MKSLIDLAVALSFFIAYLLSDIYIATITLILALYAAVIVHRLAFGEWSRAHLIGAVAATVLGGLTLAIRDPDFIKLKPTAVYGVFALGLALSTVIGERPLLQRIPQTVLRMPDALWRRVTWAWAGFFAGCALINLYVAGQFAEATWVQFKTFGYPALMFVFMLAQVPFLSRYLVDEDRPENPDAVHDPGK